MDRRTFLLAASSAGLLGAALPRPRMLMLGDSVAWGQGLREPQKMHELLAAQWFTTYDVEPTVLSYAVSGAIIGEPNGKPVEVEGWWPREAPRDNPTLHEQCTRVQADHRDRRFDVIMLAGGINDVNVRKIFDPRTDVDTIERLCRDHCRDRMGRLLDVIRRDFVAANSEVKVLVLGYYSVFSNDSRPIDLAKVLRALAIESISPRDLTARKGGLDLKARIIRNSLAFRDAANTELAAAVTAANAGPRTANFRFVDPMITDKEAAFAPDALIWGLDQRALPEDPLRPDREKYCGRLLKRRGPDRFICERASVGHPNIGGAKRYADRMMAVLQAS